MGGSRRGSPTSVADNLANSMPPSPKALTCEGRHPSRAGSGEGDGEGAGAGSNLMTDSTILEMLSSLRALKRSASAERPDTAYGVSSHLPRREEEEAEEEKERKQTGVSSIFLPTRGGSGQES